MTAHTIKLEDGKPIHVWPLKHVNGVGMETTNEKGDTHLLILTPDRAAALLFALEQSLELIDQRHKAAIVAMKVAA